MGDARRGVCCPDAGDKDEDDDVLATVIPWTAVVAFAVVVDALDIGEFDDRKKAPGAISNGRRSGEDVADEFSMERS